MPRRAFIPVPFATPAPRRSRLATALLAAGLLSAAGGALAGTLVISQVYGGGGNSGATLKNDFVELFNGGAKAIALGGMSVQYASSSGTTWQATPLPNVTLQPGQFFLVQEAQGAGGTTPLPTPDATGTITMSATNGKVALASVATALTGSCPSANVVDLVGFGSANCSETAAMAALTNTTAGARSAVCADTNNNSTDFASGAPNPRNTATPLAPCGAPINAPIVVSCPALTVAQELGGNIAISATDADSVVTGIAIDGAAVAGISLTSVVAATADGETATATLQVAPETAAGSHSVPLLFSNNEAQSATCSLPVTVQATSITRIHTIQGTGDASPLVGQTVTTEGVVTAVFANLKGYFIQEPNADGDTASSEGIFVYTNAVPTVNVGDQLRLTATVAEYNTVTELTIPTNVQVLANGVAIAPTDISLPEATEGDLERYEGMLVRIVTPLTVSQNYFQGRYGQVTLSAGERMEIPTNRHRPNSAEALALRDQNARGRIVLDDGSSLQNPNPIPHIGADNTLRAGDTVSDLTGVIDHGLITSSGTGPRDYKLHPTVTPTFSRDNPRTAAPSAVGGDLRVASFNVLNYFTTFTDGTTADGDSGQGCTLGGSTDKANCRGASNPAEFLRQQAKIVAALRAVDADVVGLMEVQNNGNTAAQNLADALNTAYGAPTYAVGALPVGGTGTDAIRVAIIYKPARVTPVGGALSDTDAIHNRPPLAQTFSAGNGEKFSVVVNHFKSKGCDGATGADTDQGDGQSCYNDRRVQQAGALATFIQQLKNQSGDGDVLVIGDLNAYGMEDPIVALTTAGLDNLIGQRIAKPYSYTFDGESGYLDHALSSQHLSLQVTGVTEWHINTDEPSVIDYNTEYKPQDLYAATAYRSSDHDPVIVGLQLANVIEGTPVRDVLTGTAGDDLFVGGLGADVLTGGAGRDSFVYRGIDEGADTVADFTPSQDRVDLRPLFAALGLTGNPFATGHARVVSGNSGAIVQIDTDGPSGPLAFRPLLTLRRLLPAQIDLNRDFMF